MKKLIEMLLSFVKNSSSASNPTEESETEEHLEKNVSAPVQSRVKMDCEILIKKDWSYIFAKEIETEKLYLSVVCGTIGIYERVIELNNEEVERYQRYGDSYIETMARKIMRLDQEFKNRSDNVELNFLNKNGPSE